MTTILAFNGVHTAGKSTFGKRLAQETGIPYLSEVAQQLIDDEGEDWGDEGDHAFQHRIHQREAARDRDILRDGYDAVIVETWHPGNIAHSREVADAGLPERQEEYVDVLLEHADVDVHAMFIDIPLEEIWERSSHFDHGDEDILEFYGTVRDNHFDVYETTEIPHTVVRNDSDIDDAYATIRDTAYEVLER